MLPAFLTPTSLCAFASFFFSPEKTSSLCNLVIGFIQKMPHRVSKFTCQKPSMEQDQLSIKATSIFVEEPWPMPPHQHDHKDGPMGTNVTSRDQLHVLIDWGALPGKDTCAVEGYFLSLLPCRGVLAVSSSPQTGTSANCPPEREMRSGQGYCTLMVFSSLSRLLMWLVLQGKSASLLPLLNGIRWRSRTSLGLGYLPLPLQSHKGILVPHSHLRKGVGLIKSESYLGIYPEINTVVL